MSKGNAQEAPVEPISIVQLLHNDIPNNQLGDTSSEHEDTFSVYITVNSSELTENHHTKCIHSVKQHLSEWNKKIRLPWLMEIQALKMMFFSKISFRLQTLPMLISKKMIQEWQ